MGMTIKSALEYLKDFDSYSPYQEAINKVSAYIEQMQANYSARLKADTVAMLEEIQLEIEEMPMHYDPRDVSDLIQQKINVLRGKEDKDGIHET